jgi:hypothetical protein
MESAMQEYEYHVIEFNSFWQMQEIINRKAAEGWRLKQMVSTVNSRVLNPPEPIIFAIMERRKEQ